MTIVFLARDGYPSRHIALALAKEFPVKVAFERGGPARRRKLKRYFAIGKFWLWPLRALDIAMALVYNFLLSRAVDQVCDTSALDPNVEIFYCDDANEDAMLAKLRQWQPTAVIIYGTAILKAQTLAAAPLFLNLHGGIVPKYRNVHCEFWALKNREPEMIGTSVLFVTNGIDSGDVLLQERIAPADAISLRRAVSANALLAAQSALKAARMVKAGSLPRTRQTELSGEPEEFATPGFFALLKMFLLGSPKF